MRVIVLGAGITGLTTAYYLAEKGYEVEVIDRQPAHSLECSFSNGGQLSYSHIEPWASPHALKKACMWLLSKDAPLVIKPKWDRYMLQWLLKFLACCRAEKVRETTQHMLNLSLYSKACTNQLTEKLQLNYHHQQGGIVHIFHEEKALEANIAQARLQQQLGCPFEILTSKDACIAKEPGLANRIAGVKGGIFFPLDEVGDVYLFGKALSEQLTKTYKVTFHYQSSISKILHQQNKIDGIETDQGILRGDGYVVCLGAYTAPLLRSIGMALPIYPLKGYSISIAAKKENTLPRRSVMEHKHKVVYTRLGNTLRVAGTAEIGGYDHHIDPKRIELLRRYTKLLFPDSGDIEASTNWACLRASTPDGMPVIGDTPYKNLFLNTGHGSLGWTLACGSAALIAKTIAGESVEEKFAPLAMKRFAAT